MSLSVFDPFDALGLPHRFDLSLAEIENRYRDLQRELHPDRTATLLPAERRLRLARAVTVNEAYRTLRDDLSRAEALARVRFPHVDFSREQTEHDPQLLMDMLEQREEVDAARVRRDREALRALEARTRGAWSTQLDAVRRAFLDTAGQPSAVENALQRLRYYRRMLEELERVADTLEEP